MLQTVKLELMNTSQIPEDAGRQMPDAAVDPVMAYLKAHFRPDGAADLLAAAEPLMAIAWDEGYMAEGSARTDNPYRSKK